MGAIPITSTTYLIFNFNYINKINIPKYRINNEIKSPSVMLIDEYGNNIGIVKISEALDKAFDSGLDLVEVSPLSNPPVCKIIDYNQFKYKEQQKLKAQQKSASKVVIKGIKLSPTIGKHDIETKLKQSTKFFEKGYKIKIEIQLKGRELNYQHMAKEVINNFIDSLKVDKTKNNIIIEDPIKFKNNKLSCIVSYKK
ncbi:MAG TPA: translation initiation factor IF-3 [bacterium]|nr:translation initiation factor IF-3 [Patescibacteria group bacterium]HOC96394.1 translation initiation factor IF-3 [bacterium]HPO11117.1 translation initiation factor IF-3 [bacterium]HQL12186.1 translation initiation factor IF-3 [bacterium]